MQKPTKKLQTVLFGIILVLVIIFMNTSLLGDVGKKAKIEEDSRAYAALEQALMEIKGVGEVTLYFHYQNDDDGEAENPLSDYFSLSTTQAKTREDNLQGVLVIAEGAANPGIQKKLSEILTSVVQLPAHRIVIVEMKKRGNTNEGK